ncbi:exonuclease SbcCD subunit D [Thiospirillum jenense]|uniref:exonuclease SbcCD subunit D n=1 Tax=Thiospirillum jenense TaxID=1653858 RepID=UPI0023AECCB9|nr:exonuclease SbcCD subunit D C-terminal domain-containing protein [Thiospirillum jenense]
MHTSDWHLGQTLHGFDRSAEQQFFLTWLLDQLVAQRIDALLISGDVFDQPNPSAEAQRQWYQFLATARLQLPRLDIVVIAGNHDSAARLEAPAAVLQPFGITVVGTVKYDASGALDTQRLVIPLHDAHGRCAAWCLAVPFLRFSDLPRRATATPAPPPAAANPTLFDPPHRELPATDAGYVRGVAAVYQQVTARAQAVRKADHALIALGHCHMSGGQVSADSERRLVIGGAEALPVEIFDKTISYAALGHLHRAQLVGQHAHRRYCGSPLPLSFAEVNYQHQVLCIELNGAQVDSIQPIYVPRPVHLLRIPAQPAPLATVLMQLRELQLPPQPIDAPPYLQVRVLLTAPEPSLRVQIETALQHQRVRLARIETTYAASAAPAVDNYRSLDELERLLPQDVFAQLYQTRYATQPSAELLNTFNELLAEVTAADFNSAAE